MSVKVILQILESPGCARGSAWNLLVGMANRANPDGTGVWESVGNIAKVCGLDRATAFRAKDQLLESGLIIDTGKFHKNGGGRYTKIYDLDLSRLAKSHTETKEETSSHNETNDLSHNETHESQFATQTCPEPVLDVDVEEMKMGPTGAHSLALRFWELQGNPARHRNSLRAWEAQFDTLLAQEPEIQSVLDWAFGQEHYWSGVLSLPSPDPMAFLSRKLQDPVDKQGSIRQKHDEWRSRLAAARRKSALRAHSPQPAAPPQDEPLWDRDKMTAEAACRLDEARKYFSLHRQEYEQQHPEWMEEFKWRRLYE